MDAASRCLVVGSLNVDLLAKVKRFASSDEAVEVFESTIAPGGHAGNGAAALSRLGRRARLLACVGTDGFGDLAIDALARARVDVDFIQRTDRAPTGFAFVPILPSGDRALFVGRAANEHLNADRLSSAAADAEAILSFDPPRALLPALTALARDRFVVYAPGGLVSSVLSVEVEQFLKAVRILSVNGPESFAMVHESSPAAAARALADRWRIQVIVTTGPDGCWLATPGSDVIHCPAFQVDVVDTTGAGDAFIAAVTSALMCGEHMCDALRCGCAAGGLATRALGAQGALPTLVEVDRLRGSLRSRPQRKRVDRSMRAQHAS